MAQVTINVPDAQVDRILRALGYTENVPGTPPKQVFFRQAVISWIKERVLIYEQSDAQIQASESIRQDVENIGIT